MAKGTNPVELGLKIRYLAEKGKQLAGKGKALAKGNTSFGYQKITPAPGGYYLSINLQKPSS